MRLLVTSIFLYACESWTLTAELQRRIQLMEIRCYRKILHISYKDHVTNEVVRTKIQQAIGSHEDLTLVKRHKLHWYGHVSRSSGLAKAIFQDTVKGGGRQGRQRKRRTTTPGNGQAWSSASPRGQWRTGEMEKTGCKIICSAPTTLAVKRLMMIMMTQWKFYYGEVVAEFSSMVCTVKVSLCKNSGWIFKHTTYTALVFLF